MPRNLLHVVLALALTASLPAAASAAPEDAPRVFLLAVAESNDKAIGTKVAEDARNTIDLFEVSFEAAGRSQQLRTKLIAGDDLTSRNVLAAVRALPVRPQDVVVVLWSGHGDMTDGKHYLSCGGGDKLSRDALVAALAARKPHLTVLLTDVCSSFPPGRTGPAVVPTTPDLRLPRGPVMPWATVESLFLLHAGVVDLTAAEPGTPAATSKTKPGSHFTNALLGALAAPHADLVRGLDRDGDRFIQWDELLPQVRGAAAASHQRENPAVKRPQHAYAWSLGEWKPVAGRTAAR
jgi:hypothetical protein